MYLTASDQKPTAQSSVSLSGKIRVEDGQLRTGAVADLCHQGAGSLFTCSQSLAWRFVPMEPRWHLHRHCWQEEGTQAKGLLTALMFHLFLWSLVYLFWMIRLMLLENPLALTTPYMVC